MKALALFFYIQHVLRDSRAGEKATCALVFADSAGRICVLVVTIKDVLHLIGV